MFVLDPVHSLRNDLLMYAEVSMAEAERLAHKASAEGRIKQFWQAWMQTHGHPMRRHQ